MNDKYDIHKLYRYHMYRELLWGMRRLGLLSHEERWEIGGECLKRLDEL